MKTDTLKKSLLDYAIKGSLTAKFRRENAGLNAFDEISTYNDNIKQKRKDLEKELKKCEKELKLEKDKDKKAFFKSQIQILKKEIAKCKEITPLNLSEAPFTIPNSWAWVKLGDICEIISGEITNLQEENLPLLDVKYLRSKGDKKLANSGNFANVNDRLILMDGENSGEIFITKEKGFLGSTLKKLEFSSLSQVEFMDFMLLCYKDFFKGNKKGAAIPHLDRKLFTNLSIPLPPLCEQQEIVKKLDLLVTLANDFAITKENLKRIEKRIEKSLLKLALEGSLSKLYRRSSPTLSAFDEINTYNEAIKEKRKDLEKELKKLESTLKKVGKRDFSPTAQNDKQRITQNAVSLENDKKACHTDLECSEREVSKNTESQLVIFASVGKSFARASECEKSTKELKQILKSQIQSLKKEIAKCKEITPLFCQESRFFANAQNDKKACHTTSPCHTDLECSEREVSNNTESKRDFSPTAQNAVSLENDNPHTPPFEIPNSWAWVKLGDIGEWKAGSTPSRAKPDFYVDGEILWLKTGDLNDDVVYHTEEKITKEAFNSYSMSFSDVGDILVAMYGATIGKTGIVGARMTTNQACCACKTNATIHNKYLFYFIQGRRDFIISQSFGTGQPNISKEKILNFLIPLPPLKEQEHIAQTLDTLFTLKKGLRVE